VLDAVGRRGRVHAVAREGAAAVDGRLEQGRRRDAGVVGDVARPRAQKRRARARERRAVAEVPARGQRDDAAVRRVPGRADVDGEERRQVDDRRARAVARN